MRSPIHLRLLLIVTLNLVVGPMWASLPKDASASAQAIEGFYKEAVATSSRIELMAISRGISIDPPPSEANFKFAAGVIISVDAPSAYDYAMQVTAAVRDSNWKATSARGHPRWYWRVVDSSGGIIAAFLVDAENRAILIGGKWYSVDQKLVTQLTSAFVGFATESLPEVRKDTKSGP